MHKLALCALGVTLLAGSALAFDDDNDHGLQARPTTFVGLAQGCAPSPAGSNIVTSAWLIGLGLPDDGSSNATPSTPPNNRDPHLGLLLSKDGATTDCSAAGAGISVKKSLTVSSATEFGFDYRNGGHCGAGAPRFNVTTSDNTIHFGGCAGGTASPAPQDPAQWTRVRLTPAQFFPPLVDGSAIKSVSIIFDEGTDTPTAGEPGGSGMIVLDNIDVNAQLITRGQGNSNGNGNGSGN